MDEATALPRPGAPVYPAVSLCWAWAWALNLITAHHHPQLNQGSFLQRAPLRALAHLHQSGLLQNPWKEAASPQPLGRDSADMQMPPKSLEDRPRWGPDRGTSPCSVSLSLSHENSHISLVKLKKEKPFIVQEACNCRVNKAISPPNQLFLGGTHLTLFPIPAKAHPW